MLSSRFDRKLPPPELAARIETLASFSGHESAALIREINSYLLGTRTGIPSALSEETKQELVLLKEEYQNVTFKSPVFAGVLSAVLPGSGKIYTGDTGDGVTALILTSLFGYLAYTNFENDHPTRGYLLGAAAAGFYLGNIYGSYISARLSNEKTQFDIKSELGNFIIQNNWFLGFSLELPCDP